MLVSLVIIATTVATLVKADPATDAATKAAAMISSVPACGAKCLQSEFVDAFAKSKSVPDFLQFCSSMLLWSKPNTLNCAFGTSTNTCTGAELALLQTGTTALYELCFDVIVPIAPINQHLVNGFQFYNTITPECAWNCNEDKYIPGMTDFTYAFLNYTAEIPNVTYAKMGDMYSKFKTVCTNYTSTALRACANAACTKPADLAITDAFAKNTDFYCKLENNATNNLLSDGWFTLSRIPSCALNSCLNDKYFSRGSRDFFWNLQTEAGFTDMCFGYNYTSFEECASSMSLGKCGAEDLAAIKTVESSFTKVCSLFTANRTKPRTTTTTASATSTRATVSTATPSKTSAAFGVFATFNLIFVVGVLSLLEL